MNTFGPLQFPTEPIYTLAKTEATPFYIYDEKTIIDRCKTFMQMPNSFGVLPRFAMKANSSKALLQLIAQEGLGIDASSLNEARRAVLAGIHPKKIMLTTQEAPLGKDLEDVISLVKEGMTYTICSLTQAKNIVPYVNESINEFAVRLHPGVGTGETTTRDTGGDYASFGVHLSNIEELLALAGEFGITFTKVHVHIGSGGDPKVWQDNIDRELSFIERWFPHVTTVNFGGGFKDARMPNESAADINALGEYAKNKIEEFYKKTGRKLFMEVEPGTYIMANAGYLVTRVADIKQTGAKGFTFVLLNGGMEVLSRPLLYGSEHPFYIIESDGSVRYDEFVQGSQDLQGQTAGAADLLARDLSPHIIVGRCCETGDSFTLDEAHNIVTRNITRPEVGDLFVVGGSGAYASSMTPFNYNSHNQIAEYLYRINGKVQLIRKRQTLAQIVQNEIDL